MTTVYIPCQVFEVPVTAGPSKKLSRLERLALEAIYAGVSKPELTYFRDLVKLFQLGHRPTLDLVVDLWRRGYVAVDIEQRLWITEPVKQRIGRLEDLVSGQVKQVRLSVMQELVSGHVLSYQRGPTVFEPIRVVPPAIEFGSLRRASLHEVMQVLERQLEQRFSREDEPWKVLDMNLGFTEHPDMAPRVRHTLLEARVECIKDEAAERTLFRLQYPQSLSARARADIEAILADMAESRADHPFYRKITAEAEQGLPPAFVDPGELSERLLREVQHLGQVNAGNIAHFHDELLEHAGEVKRWYQEQRSQRVEVKILETIEDHEAAFDQVIEAAEKQLVLVAAHPRYSAFDRLRPAIEGALNDGVSVFLIWGGSRDDKLDTALGNLLGTLKASHRLHVLYAERPARIKASFLIADDRHLLVTSWHFLEHGGKEDRKAFRDLGFHVMPASVARQASPIKEALEWVAQHHPERRLAQRMKVSVGRSDESDGDELANTALELTAFDFKEDASYRASHLGLWQQQWKAMAARLEQIVTRPGLTARWIADGRHREVLWSVLRRPGRWLLILSWKLDRNIAKPIMVEALRNWLKGGARILIGFREEVTSCVELRELEAQFPVTFRLRQLTGDMPQLLMTEELCLLSSYGFLSFTGFYDQHRAHEISHDLGVILRGGDAVRRILDSVTRWLPEAALLAQELAPSELAVASVPGATVPLPPEAVLAGLQELVSELARRPDDGDDEQEWEERRTELLHRWFREADAAAAWAALDVLAAVDFPDIERAVASCLALQPAEGDGLKRDRWLGWLVDHLWYHGEVWQRPDNALRAAVLSESLDSMAVPYRRPPQWMALLTAARCQPAILSDQLMNGVLRPSLSESEVLALTAVGISAILEQVEVVQLACDSLDLLDDRLPEALRRCVSGVREFWGRTGRSLPSATLEQWANDSRRLARAADLRRDFLQQVERERQRRFNFSLARAAWSVLFGEQGPLASLIAAVRAEDPRLVRKRLEEVGRDLGSLLDEATSNGIEKAGFLLDRREQDRRIVNQYRTSYLRQLGDFFAVAEHWADLRQPVTEMVDTVYRPSVARLSREMKALLPDLEAFAVAREGPDGPLLRGLSRDLRSVAEIEA